MKEKLNLVHILGNYYFSLDGTQYTLVRRVVRNKRGLAEVYEDEETLGYFSTLSGLLKKIAKDCLSEEIQSGSITNIKEAISEYDAITSRLENIVGF